MSQLLASSLPAEQPQLAGVWLSLEQLRGLSLPQAERLRLQRQLLAMPQPRRSAQELLLGSARLTFLCCDDSLTAGAGDEALQHHDELLGLLEPLIAFHPKRAPAVWATYGNLLGQLATAAHKLIVEAGDQGLKPRRRVGLSARLVPVLSQGLQRPSSTFRTGCRCWRSRLCTWEPWRRTGFFRARPQSRPGRNWPPWLLSWPCGWPKSAGSRQHRTRATALCTGPLDDAAALVLAPRSLRWRRGPEADRMAGAAPLGPR